MEPKIVPPQELREALSDAPAPREWNWAPLAVALVLVAGVASAALLLSGRGRHTQEVAPVSATPDPYAQFLTLSNLALSESSNLAGGKITYLDGQIANTGTRTVTEVVLQVVFRNAAGQVAQSEVMSLMLVRMRDPYIDTVRMSAAPLTAGTQRDFRLNFDAVSGDWSGSVPELRILRVQSK